MKNFVQSGEWALTVIAPAGGVVAGAIVIVGSLVGVATGTASAGAEVEIRPEGVYDLSKVPADALAAGAIAKVDPATGIVGAAGTKNIGSSFHHRDCAPPRRMLPGGRRSQGSGPTVRNAEPRISRCVSRSETDGTAFTLCASGLFSNIASWQTG